MGVEVRVAPFWDGTGHSRVYRAGRLEGVLDIGELFKILFRTTDRREDGLWLPDATARLIRWDEHRLLQLPAMVLVLDTRFAQRLADVCGQLPKAVLGVVGPHR